MRTSYFWKATHEPEPNIQYVSIARGNIPNVNLPTYPDLMPSWDVIKIAKDSNYSKESLPHYYEAYYQQLDKLDPEKVYNDLAGKTIVCFESAKDLASGAKYCHRRIVAGWIWDKLGIMVPEELRVSEQNLNVPAIVMPRQSNAFRQ